MGSFDYKQPNAGCPRPTGTLDGVSAFRSCVGVSGYPFDYAPIKVVVPGACTANTLKTILSLSGKGVISALGVGSGDVASRTHRIKVTLDGVVIFDATTAATTNLAIAFMAIGSINYLVTSVTATVAFEPLAFNQSLLVQYASSITETDKAYIGYRYYPT